MTRRVLRAIGDLGELLWQCVIGLITGAALAVIGVNLYWAIQDTGHHTLAVAFLLAWTVTAAFAVVAWILRKPRHRPRHRLRRPPHTRRRAVAVAGLATVLALAVVGAAPPHADPQPASPNTAGFGSP